MSPVSQATIGVIVATINAFRFETKEGKNEKESRERLAAGHLFSFNSTPTHACDSIVIDCVLMMMPLIFARAATQAAT